MADQAVKEDVKNASKKVINVSNKQLSMSYIRKDINKIAEEEWTEIWKKVNQDQQYSKFQLESVSRTRLEELKQAKRLMFLTFT